MPSRCRRGEQGPSHPKGKGAHQKQRVFQQTHWSAPEAFVFCVDVGAGRRPAEVSIQSYPSAISIVLKVDRSSGRGLGEVIRQGKLQFFNDTLSTIRWRRPLWRNLLASRPVRVVTFTSARSEGGDIRVRRLPSWRPWGSAPDQVADDIRYLHSCHTMGPFLRRNTSAGQLGGTFWLSTD